jgi:hypothetical protein
MIDLNQFKAGHGGGVRVPTHKHWSKKTARGGMKRSTATTEGLPESMSTWLCFTHTGPVAQALVNPGFKSQKILLA